MRSPIDPRRSLGVALALMALVAVLVSASPSAARPTGPGQERLRWRPCHHDVTAETGIVFECARTRVPLDYDKPRGRSISLDLIRVPATDPANRIGAILANPGGPGGSGVGFVLGLGPFVSLAYGPEVAERFDLVGFDPRGVAGSTPIRCFRTFEDAVASRPPIPFPLSVDEIALFEAADTGLAAACSARPQARLIGRHMSTANAARDMDVIRQRLGDDQISYLGLSYGTFLGATYANLFPERVRSFVLDGVVDPNAYVNPEGEVPAFNRLRNDEGAQETLERFFELCEEASPGSCALAPDARNRFAALADALFEAPLVVVDPGTGEEVVVTYQQVISGTLFTLYIPGLYAQLAADLAVIESLIAAPAEAAVASDAARAALAVESRARQRVPYNNVIEAQTGVFCSDSNHPTDYGVWFEAGIAADEAYGYFGRPWNWIASACARWPFTDEDRYVGPFTAATANPILVIGNLYDPATRYEGAVALRSLLPNSGLLTVDVPGHTSLGISACAGFVAGQYFLQPDVALSVDGDVCPVEFNPFDVVGASDQAQMTDLHRSLMEQARLLPPAMLPATG